MKKLLKYKRLIIIALLVIVLGIVCALVVFKKDSNISLEEKEKPNIENVLKEKEKLIIYVENTASKKCSKCSSIKKYIDSKNLNYYLFDVNKESKEEYDKLLDTLSINKKVFNYPAIIYLQDGIMFANIINIEDTNVVDQFIEDYDLTNVK